MILTSHVGYNLKVRRNGLVQILRLDASFVCVERVLYGNVTITSEELQLLAYTSDL